MARASDAAVVAIASAIAAVLLLGSLDHQLPASAYTGEAPPLRREVQVPLAAGTATAALFASAGYVFRHLPHAAAAGGNRRLSEVAIFTMCASVGVLQHVVFVQPPAAGVAINVNIGAVGLAAARAFFLGMALVFAQVRAGGGGHGGAVLILSNVALGAAAVVVALMAMAAALYTAY